MMKKNFKCKKIPPKNAKKSKKIIKTSKIKKVVVNCLYIGKKKNPKNIEESEKNSKVPFFKIKNQESQN